jgi:alkylation response protein AidB-like acyl-CoA dehydrogenase
VGAELVCDAIVLHGRDDQKERYVAPLLRGELFAAECLTEPRGGSDFFGTTPPWLRTGATILSSTARSGSSSERKGADFFLVYARTDPDARPHQDLTCFIVDRGRGWRSNICMA